MKSLIKALGPGFVVSVFFFSGCFCLIFAFLFMANPTADLLLENGFCWVKRIIP